MSWKPGTSVFRTEETSKHGRVRSSHPGQGRFWAATTTWSPAEEPGAGQGAGLCKQEPHGA